MIAEPDLLMTEGDYLRAKAMHRDNIVEKYCVKCGHKIPGMKLCQNATCWCGELMYPYIGTWDGPTKNGRGIVVECF